MATVVEPDSFLCEDVPASSKASCSSFEVPSPKATCPQCRRRQLARHKGSNCIQDYIIFSRQAGTKRRVGNHFQQKTFQNMSHTSYQACKTMRKFDRQPGINNKGRNGGLSNKRDRTKEILYTRSWKFNTNLQFLTYQLSILTELFPYERSDEQPNIMRCNGSTIVVVLAEIALVFN